MTRRVPSYVPAHNIRIPFRTNPIISSRLISTGAGGLCLLIALPLQSLIAHLSSSGQLKKHMLSFLHQMVGPIPTSCQSRAIYNLESVMIRMLTSPRLVTDGHSFVQEQKRIS